jgi:hypothetical protein
MISPTLARAPAAAPSDRVFARIGGRDREKPVRVEVVSKISMQPAVTTRLERADLGEAEGVAPRASFRLPESAGATVRTGIGVEKSPVFHPSSLADRLAAPEPAT